MMKFYSWPAKTIKLRIKKVRRKDWIAQISQKFWFQKLLRMFFVKSTVFTCAPCWYVPLYPLNIFSVNNTYSVHIYGEVQSLILLTWLKIMTRVFSIAWLNYFRVLSVKILSIRNLISHFNCAFLKLLFDFNYVNNQFSLLSIWFKNTFQSQILRQW